MPEEMHSSATIRQEDPAAGAEKRISLILEITQSVIALMVTGAVILTAIYKIPSSDLANAFFVIIGFYYGRMTHAAIESISRKARQEEKRT